MSNRSRSAKRHRFYRHLFAVTLLMVLMQALPSPVFRVHLVSSALLQMLLLLELGQVLPRQQFRGVGPDPVATHYARLYRGLGIFGLVFLLFWIFTPASSTYTGLPVMVLVTAFVFWSLQRLLGMLAGEETVGREVIAGAVAGYLLLGICGGLLLTVLETVQPGSFQNLTHHHGDHRLTTLIANPDLSRLIWDLDFSRINYFAFVALTTTGFGDIVPVTPPAEMASVALSVSGALYLALVMGLLISRFTVQTQQQEELGMDGEQLQPHQQAKPRQ